MLRDGNCTGTSRGNIVCSALASTWGKAKRPEGKSLFYLAAAFACGALVAEAAISAASMLSMLPLRLPLLAPTLKMASPPP